MRVPLGVYRITVKAKKFASDSDTLAVAQQTEEFSRILSPKNCKHCLLIDANPWRRNFEMAMKKVDVVGYGPMGSGIAQVSAMAGFDTSVLEVEQRVLDKSFAGIEKSLSKYARSTAL